MSVPGTDDTSQYRGDSLYHYCCVPNLKYLATLLVAFSRYPKGSEERKKLIEGLSRMDPKAWYELFEGWKKHPPSPVIYKEDDGGEQEIVFRSCRHPIDRIMRCITKMRNSDTSFMNLYLKNFGEVLE